VSDSVERFQNSLRDLVPAETLKLDTMLEVMSKTDPALHEVVMEALTARNREGQWRVPTSHIEQALRDSGYTISHDSVRRWRRRRVES